MRLILVSFLIVAIVVSGWLSRGEVFAADEPVAPSALQHFTQHVAPVLAAKCVSCHRADNLKGNFDLTTLAGLLKGGDSGAALTPGKPTESSLYTRAIPHNGARPEMPEKGEPLTPVEADALKSWIAAGAPWPEKFVVREKAKADASFWSFQPLAKVEPPVVANVPAGWDQNPIDRFVLAKMREHLYGP